jgi:hypothetical protein
MIEDADVTLQYYCTMLMKSSVSQFSSSIDALSGSFPYDGGDNLLILT